MNNLRYPVIIEPLPQIEGGGFVALVPDLPGCMSDGETIEEAARNVQDQSWPGLKQRNPLTALYPCLRPIWPWRADVASSKLTSPECANNLIY